MKHLLWLPALLWATTAQAGPVLWNNIEKGMSKEAVKALYPEAVKGQPKPEHEGWGSMGTWNTAWQLSERCTVGVEIRFNKAKLVKEVYLDHNYYKDKCGDAILIGLTKKYGEPQRADEYQTPAIVALLARRGTIKRSATTKWVTDTVRVTLWQDLNDPNIFNILYQAADKELDETGL